MIILGFKLVQTIFGSIFAIVSRRITLYSTSKDLPKTTRLDPLWGKRKWEGKEKRTLRLCHLPRRRQCYTGTSGSVRDFYSYILPPSFDYVSGRLGRTDKNMSDVFLIENVQNYQCPLKILHIIKYCIFIVL